MGKSRSATSIRSLYEADLRKAYGDLTAPRRGFALEIVKREPYSALLLDLVAAHGFRLVPAGHPETPVPVVPGRAEVPAVLFEPGAEPPWR
jgi:hypothetical protein